MRLERQAIRGIKFRGMVFVVQSSSDDSCFEQVPLGRKTGFQSSTARLAHVVVVKLCNPDYASLGGEAMGVVVSIAGASEVSRFTSASSFVELSSANSS